jgi:hypothetical protein
MDIASMLLESQARHRLKGQVPTALSSLIIALVEAYTGMVSHGIYAPRGKSNNDKNLYMRVKLIATEIFFVCFWMNFLLMQESTSSG